MNSILVVDLYSTYLGFVQQYNAKLDYVKLIEGIRAKDGLVTSAYAFGQNKGNSKKFIQMLKHLNVETKMCPNHKIEMTMFLLQMQAPKLIVVTDDSSFVQPLKALSDRGVEITQWTTNKNGFRVVHNSHFLTEEYKYEQLELPSKSAEPANQGPIGENN